MNSIFHLKTSESELASANQGVAKMSYLQVSDSREASGPSFANAPLIFNYEYPTNVWNPKARDYMRMRATLSKPDNTSLQTTDGIAVNMNLPGALFQEDHFDINGKTVSRAASYVPQISSLETRIVKSRSWLNGAGRVLEFLSENFNLRLSDVCSDGIVNTDTLKGETTTNRVQLGFVPPTTLQYTHATRTIVFATGAVPEYIFPVGSKIQLIPAVGAAPANSIFTVVDTPTPTSIVIDKNTIGADEAAAVIDFNRIEAGEVGKPGRRLIHFELTFVPPLSIFKIDHALPGGANYKLVLTPYNKGTFERNAIESIFGVNSKIPDIDYKFEVTDIKLYVSLIDGPRMDNGTYLIDLDETRCQATKVQGSGFTQTPFNVSPSTYALSIAYQDMRVGTDTRISPTKFRSYDPAVTAPQENKLTRFFVNYANQNKPQPDADPSFTVDTDHLTQRYVETMLNNGTYYDSPESINEYIERGMYFYFPFPKDATDLSTRVMIHQQFDNNPDTTANMNVLLFDHYRTTVRVTIDNGRVTDVQLEQA